MGDAYVFRVHLLQGCSQEERAKAILSQEVHPCISFVLVMVGPVLPQSIETLYEFACSRSGRLLGTRECVDSQCFYSWFRATYHL